MEIARASKDVVRAASDYFVHCFIGAGAGQGIEIVQFGCGDSDVVERFKF